LEIIFFSERKIERKIFEKIFERKIELIKFYI